MAIAIQFVSETGSTNADLLARLKDGVSLHEGSWLVADRQSGGRGRQGRTWLDGAGNFMGSTVVRLSPHDPPPHTLSFVAALAVREAVLPHVADTKTLTCKWPNDVMLAAAKLAGILLERSDDNVVVGIGVNLAAAPALDDRTAAALAAPDRDGFARDLAETFAIELARWREYGVEPLLARWTGAAHPLGTPLSVHDPRGGVCKGTFAGLAEDGALRLRLPDGTTHAIHAGDVMLEAL